MKKLLNFAMIICTCFYLSSCSDEELSKKSNEILPPNIEDYLAKRYQDIVSSGKKVIIEHATLEEINEAMRANGLEEFRREDIARIQQSMMSNRTTFSCDEWNTAVDWNDNGVYNVVDLVLAKNWICQMSIPAFCKNTIDIWNCTTDCPPGEAVNFALLSHFSSGVDPYFLNRNDVDAGATYLVGNIPCY